MSRACLLTVLTCGAFAAPAVCPTASGSITIVMNTSLPFQLQRSRTALRKDYRALQRAARRVRSDPFALTPKLVGLYVELSDPDSLPKGERNAKFHALRVQLRKMHNKLVPVAAKGRGESKRRRSAKPQIASAAGGGGTAARAGQLIRLIQSTISPESWDVNGGTNSIQFYAPLNVLVVRAPGEVHHQIGGTLPNLKP